MGETDTLKETRLNLEWYRHDLESLRPSFQIPSYFGPREATNEMSLQLLLTDWTQRPDDPLLVDRGELTITILFRMRLFALYLSVSTIFPPCLSLFLLSLAFSSVSPSCLFSRSFHFTNKSRPLPPKFSPFQIGISHYKSGIFGLLRTSQSLVFPFSLTSSPPTSHHPSSFSIRSRSNRAPPF